MAFPEITIIQKTPIQLLCEQTSAEALNTFLHARKTLMDGWDNFWEHKIISPETQSAYYGTNGKYVFQGHSALGQMVYSLLQSNPTLAAKYPVDAKYFAAKYPYTVSDTGIITINR